ncbi:MAG: hypothetical protein RID91_08975 [Azospirillaceae bacterium]
MNYEPIAAKAAERAVDFNAERWLREARNISLKPQFVDPVRWHGLDLAVGDIWAAPKGVQLILELAYAGPEGTAAVIKAMREEKAARQR